MQTRKSRALCGMVCTALFLMQASVSLYGQCDPSRLVVADRMDDLASWHAIASQPCPVDALQWGPACPDAPSIKLSYAFSDVSEGTEYWAVMESASWFDMSAGDVVALCWRGDPNQYGEDHFGGTSQPFELSFRDDPNSTAVDKPVLSVGSHVPASRWFLFDKRLFTETTWDSVQVHIGVSGTGGTPEFSGRISVDTIGTMDSLTAREQYRPARLGKPLYRDDFGEMCSAAASWIAQQQAASGYLKSWHEESSANAYAYTQGMGLRVLTRTDPTRASDLVQALLDEDPFADDPQRDGLWWECRYADSQQSVDTHALIGSNGAIVRGLATWLKSCPEASPAVLARLRRAASTLISHQDPACGCVVEFEPGADGKTRIPTEGNWNAYFALASLATLPQFTPEERLMHRDAADQILGCLSRPYRDRNDSEYNVPGCWDPDLQRWYGGLEPPPAGGGQYDCANRAIYLDANTLGAIAATQYVAPELRRSLQEQARSALAFVRLTLGTSDAGWPGADPERPIVGLDSAGPHLPWNEGTLQYMMAAGSDPNSDVFFEGILRQIEPAGKALIGGSLPWSVAEFGDGLVQLEPWHGVDPTAWLYLALSRCVGDMNCDGLVDFGDINSFVLYLSNFSAWQATYPDCDPRNGDIDGDGMYGQGSFGDINPFVDLLSSRPLPIECP